MTDMPGIDDPPISKSVTGVVVDGESDSDKEKKPDPPETGNRWKVYLSNQWISVLMSRNKLLYGFYTGGWYLLQFVGCVAVINLYSDKDRKIVCDSIREAGGDPLDWPEKSSDVFDFPLLMLALYHMIEWIRTTVLLTIVCIGVNWTWIWYVTTFNSLFGIVVYAIVHMVYMSDDGKSCNDAQEWRGMWLLVEIIAFWSLFFCCAFPMICTVLCGKEKADRQLKEWHEDSESDSD